MGLLPPIVESLLGLGKAPPITLADKPPAWRTRIKEAAYTSPDGKRIRFDFTDVSREFELRGTPFEFPQVNDAYVQKKGFGARKYRWTCYFSGPNHDLIATAFEAALCEPGNGKLEHPFYGLVTPCVPFGTVQRNDALATAANQSVVQVTFWTTTGAVYPNSDPATHNEIALMVKDFNVEAAQAFAKKIHAPKAPDRANLIATIKDFVKKISASMSAISSKVASVRREMQDIQDGINFGIDVLIGQPLLLAQQLQNLVLAPARAVVGIESRLDAYYRLASDVFGSNAMNPTTTIAGSGALIRRNAITNDFHLSDLIVLSAVAGTVIAVSRQAVAGRPAELQGAPASCSGCSSHRRNLRRRLVQARRWFCRDRFARRHQRGADRHGRDRAGAASGR